MKRYKMQGTPSSVLIGRDGRIRHHGFGQEDDMALGMLIGSLLAEKVSTKPPATLDKQLTGAAGAEQGPVLP